MNHNVLLIVCCMSIAYYPYVTQPSDKEQSCCSPIKNRCKILSAYLSRQNPQDLESAKPSSEVADMAKHNNYSRHAYWYDKPCPTICTARRIDYLPPLCMIVVGGVAFITFLGAMSKF